MQLIRDITYLSIITRSLLAIVIGGALGFERGQKNQPAGVRTHMLVSLGACIVMMVNQSVYQAADTGDPVRMGAQVISGIGFLGAGTIIVTRGNRIKGLTTAAGLWTSACVGLAVGIGLYEIAIFSTVMIFLVMEVMQSFNARMKSKRRIVDLYIELDKNVRLRDFLRYTQENNLIAKNIQLNQNDFGDKSMLEFIVTLTGQNHQLSGEILKAIREMDGVVFVEEL